MTDTKDIEALREKYELSLKDLTERLMECNRLNYCMYEITAFAAFSSTLIDQLEAERQRAEALQGQLDYRNEVLTRAIRQREAAEAELAALKGDQVPVEYQMYYHNHGTGGGEWCRVRTKARYEELQIEHAGDNDFSFRTLFTAPQKPVVLLPKFTDRHTCINAGCDAASAYKEDVIAMNKAAGGIVKDGE